jgi:hypothetical protein
MLARRHGSGAVLVHLDCLVGFYPIKVSVGQTSREVAQGVIVLLHDPAFNGAFECVFYNDQAVD